MFYSFLTQSRETVDVPEHRLTIGEGIDTFNLTLDDVETFKKRLRSLGVSILQANQLDMLEPVAPNLIEVLNGNECVREEDHLLGGDAGQDSTSLPS